MSICILQGFYTSQSDGHVDHNQNMFVFEPCHCKLTHDLCLQKASQLVRFALLNSNKTKNPVKQTRFDHAPKTRANFYQPDAFKKKNSGLSDAKRKNLPNQWHLRRSNSALSCLKFQCSLNDLFFFVPIP